MSATSGRPLMRPGLVMRRCLALEFGVVGIAVAIPMLFLALPVLLPLAGHAAPAETPFAEQHSVYHGGQTDAAWLIVSAINPLGVLVLLEAQPPSTGSPRVDAYAVLYGYTPSRAVASMATSLVMAMFLVALVCAFPLKRGRGLERVGFAPLWRDSYLSWTLGLFVAFVGVGSLHRLIPDAKLREMFSWAGDGFTPVVGDGSAGGVPLWLVALAVVVASITTETIARGYLFSRLRLAGLSLRWTVAASAFVYALLALPLGFGAMVAMAIYSIPACLVFRRVGSLTPLILAATLGHAAMRSLGLLA